jgi:hypothetical protein
MSEFSAVFLTKIEELKAINLECRYFTEQLQKAVSYLQFH